MSTYPALQNLINPTIRTFFRRMVRWSRLRIKMLPGKVKMISSLIIKIGVTIVEPFSECFLSGLLFSLGVGHFTDFISTPAIFSLFTAWWLTMDIILVYGLQVSSLSEMDKAFSRKFYVYKIFILCLVIRRKNTSSKVHSSLDSARVLYYPDSTNSPAKTRR